MENNSDRGFVSGFIGVGIHMTIQHILQDIHIANCCKKELADLKELVMSIELTIMHIQQNRMAFKSGEDKDTSSAVNRWLNDLDGLLLKASKMVQPCLIPAKSLVNFSVRQSKFFSVRQSKKKICSLIKAIREHLKSSPLLVRIPEDQMEDTQKVLEGLGKTKDSLEPLASSATTSQAARKELIVGQNQAFENLQKLVIENVNLKESNMVEQEKPFADLERFVIDNAEAPKIVVVGTAVGDDGAAKSLLLKTVFNTQKVRSHFSNGNLLLWLSPSQIRSSVTSVVNDLCQKIVKQKEDLKTSIKEGEEKQWLSDELQKSSRFALFLDDARETDVGKLQFEELGIAGAITTKSNVIVSSRDLSAFSEMGVAKYTITIQDLNQEDSWELFKHHAFPYHINGNLPSNIDEEKAKLVCNKCAGLPLAIKVVGAAMAGSTHPQQWEWDLHRLENADNLDAYLKLSFDAMGNEDFNMQLCFLHIAAAFPEDAIIEAQEAIPLWMGEGLLARKKVEHVPRHVLADHCLIEPMIRNTEGRPVCLRMQDPFQIGKLYLDLLAERCLIQPTARDADGLVLCFRMLNIVRDWAILIARDEENFYRCVDNGNGLEHLQNNKESSKFKRIFLSGNNLSSLPQFSSSSEMRSLLISEYPGLTKIPKKVIGSMLSLKVLDLSGTSARSLPNVACLKELICLKLSGTRIKELPKSVTGLGHLEILDVSFTDIKELPSDIHKLRSLRYLGLRGCTDLQYLPSSISSLLSLQYLYMDGCSRMWTKPSGNRRKNVMDGCRKVAPLQSLGDLIQLKQLALQTNGEQQLQHLPDGNRQQLEQLVGKQLEQLLKSMTEMDTLLLVLPEMVSLPLHISDMSKLRSLTLKCSKLIEINSFICSSLTETEVEIKNDVTHLKHLSYLKFYECAVLKDFQHLHKLPYLRQLEIILCPVVEKFPEGFGEKKAFPSLKTFSLVGLPKLQGLPEIQEGAMPSLEIFTVMDCPILRMPQSYLNLKATIKVFGCPNIMAEQQVPEPINTRRIIADYLQRHRRKEKWLSGECCCNELFKSIEDMRTLR